MKNFLNFRTFGFFMILLCATLPAYVGWRLDLELSTIGEIYIIVFLLVFYIACFIAVFIMTARTLIKFVIVSEYEAAIMRGKKISYMKLDTCNKLFWIYNKVLRGNSYVEHCINKMQDMENFGEEI